MNRPTIVTAFFDIGRGTWNSPNLPGYLKRTTEEYFTRFERLLDLENDIIVYTSPDLLDRFNSYRQQKPNLQVVYVQDWESIWFNFRSRIEAVYKNPEFYMNIQQPWNPEYWSVNYVMVNFLKSYFVNNAIDNGLVKDNMVAWIDFGYARESRHVPVDLWSYDFDPKKIHFFSTKQHVPDYTDIRKLIETNDVFIMGCHIVASKSNWSVLQDSVVRNIDYLLDHNMIDDDQTILYMCYIDDPSRYEIHYVNASNWFIIFRNFNNDFVSQM